MMAAYSGGSTTTTCRWDDPRALIRSSALSFACLLSRSLSLALSRSLFLSRARVLYRALSLPPLSRSCHSSHAFSHTLPHTLSHTLSLILPPVYHTRCRLPYLSRPRSTAGVRNSSVVGSKVSTMSSTSWTSEASLTLAAPRGLRLIFGTTTR
jgi:hypothetical protein